MSAELIATTSDIRDQDFLAGNDNFGIASANPRAAVVNQGSIKVATGGAAVLAAPGVANQGVIEATLGTVTLGGGNAFTVDFQGDRLLSFAITQPVTAPPADGAGQSLPALVSNSGTIAASGGQVLITAAAARNVVDNVINMSGTVVATTAHEVDGAIIIDAGTNGTASVSGTLDASGRNAGETGGTIKVLGSAVELVSGAKLDASGDVGGGTVLVGGNLHGAGPEANAQSTLVAQGAAIAADAATRGNGGTVVVWADGNTVFNGSISVQGGAQGGNGGFVETSGKNQLGVATGAVDALAANGRVGTWLLDPQNIVIQSSGNANFSGDQSFTGNPGASNSLSAAAIGAASANVTLQATNIITVAAPVSMANNGVGLTLDAGNTISVLSGAAITTRGGSITFDANCCGYATGSGTISVLASLSTVGGGRIGGGVNLTATGGMALVALGANITAGGGIAINGPIALQASIAIDSSAGGGAITLGTVTGGANSLALASGSGTISLGSVTTSKNLTLTTSGKFTQSQPISAAMLLLQGGGSFSLNDGANSVGTLAGNVGSVSFTDNASLSIGLVGTSTLFSSGGITLTETAASGGMLFNGTVVADGTLTASTANGNITIAPGATLTAKATGNALVLEPGVNVAAGVTTGGDFVNNSGLTANSGPAAALGTPRGNWLVYTGDLNDNGTSVGGLTSYGERYGTAAGYVPAIAANSIFYRAAPILTVTAANQSMTYGGVVPSLTFTSSGEVNGDAQAAALAGSPSLSTTASSASNVGSYAIAVGNGTITNPLNYTLSFEAGGLAITPATLTVTPNAVAAIYNATALDNPGYSDNPGSYSIAGFRNGDTLSSAQVTLAGSLAFNGSTTTVVRNAGAYTEGQGNLALSSDHGNYVIGFAKPAANEYVINPLAVVLTGVRTYDGTTGAAAGILAAANDLDGHNLTLSGTGSLTGRNVGSNGFSSSAGLALGGSAAGNYTLANVTSNGSAVTITPAGLTIAAASDAKVYDGTTFSSAAPTVLGLVGGDTATSLAEAFQSKNVLGTNGSTLAVTGYSLNDGNNGANYTVSLQTALGTITPAGLTIAAASDAKIYDGTTFSSAAPTVLGLVGGDTAANLAQAFQSKNVLGTNGSTLQVTGYSLNDGNNGGNYTVSLQTALGTITPAGLTIAAASDAKIYDGTTFSSAAPTVLGLVGGDTATNLAEAFQSKNVLGTNGSTLPSPATASMTAITAPTTR